MHVPDLALGPLMDASRSGPPDALADMLVATTPRLGLRDPRLYLADLEQLVLVPAPRSGEDGLPTLAIEGTLGGRAFTTTDVVVSNSDGGLRVWVPVLDGVARLGVLAITLDAYDDAVRRTLLQFGGWLAVLLEAKTAFTDHYTVLRHRRPLSLAAQVQWQLLPPLTAQSPWTTVAGNLAPAYQIGGDAFDYALDAGIQHVAVFDSMGHDLGASAVTSIALGAYRFSREADAGLAETYGTIDAALAEVFGHERFATAQLARLDTATGILDWCNAGHPPPLLVRDGRVVGRLECPPARPLGMWHERADEPPPEVASVSLEVGDQVLFVSDGMLEARDAEGRSFGEERVGDLLRRALLDGFPPAETVRRLAQAVLAHQPGAPRDDVTILLVQFKAKR